MTSAHPGSASHRIPLIIPHPKIGVVDWLRKLTRLMLGIFQDALVFASAWVWYWLGKDETVEL